MPLDPSEHTVRELRDELGEVDDVDELEAALEAEREGDNRTTAIDAIEGRLNAVREAAAEGEEAPEAEEDAEPEPEPEEAEEAEPEPEPEPKRSYPDADSPESVYYDPIGAGGSPAPPPPITGHDTVHLLDDNLKPRCGARVGGKGQAIARSALAEDIDECQACL